MTAKKELVVIGAGPGGYAAAFRAADLGLKVTLIDPKVNPGGVCLYEGCIPSKALLHVAKVKKEAMEASQWGIQFKEPDINAGQVNEWKDKVVEKLTKGLGQIRKSKKITYIKGIARFISSSSIEVKKEGGEKDSIEFENLIIATGSEVISLPDIKIDHEVIINSSDALDLKEIPKTMLVVGGGYIGLEMACVYASLGTKVSVAEMTEGFLPGTDKDLVEVFNKINSDLFEETYFNTSVEKIQVKNNKAVVTLKNNKDDEEKSYDKVLMAIGRKPSTNSLDLDNASIEVDDKGFIKVDEKRGTSQKNIYAIGDVAEEPMLAHKATYEGRVTAEVIAEHKGAAYDPKAIPAVVFTDPEIAWCGLQENEANKNNRKIKTVKFPWSASGRAATMGESTGITKLIIDKKSEVILGGAVAGKHAGSLISEIALAIEMGSTAEDVSLTIHPHPTLSETIMETAEVFLGSPTHLSVK